MMNKLQAAEQLRKALQIFAATLTDEQALEIATVYPAWQSGWAYSVGEVISYGTNSLGDPQLYKVVQAHTSQADWTPDATPTLYDAFGLDESGYPLWAQPSGAHDAYGTGDIVNYNGTLYQSLIDGNVWSPDVYPAGWTVYEEAAEPESPEPTPEPDPEPDPEPEPEPDPEEPEDPEEPASYPEWVQPTGSHDAYNTGDRVTYNGKVYESTMDGNTWSPDAYPSGWEEVTEA